MDNRNKEITFDGFVRGLMVVAGVGAAFFVVRYLSEVLLPFFMAWLLAYLIYPMVTFFQYRCHLHFRILSIIVSLLVTAAVVAGLCALVIPPTLNEFASLRGEISHTIQEFGDSSINFKVILHSSAFDSQFLLKHEFIKALTRRFREEGIEIPYPIRTVLHGDDVADGR